MFVLDSSVIIEILGGSPEGAATRDLVQGNAVATTSISYGEVMSGVNKKIEVVAEQFFTSVTILDFTAADAKEGVRIEKELRKKGRMIERMDIFIAGICKNQNATLVTCDKGFRHISSVDVEVVE